MIHPRGNVSGLILAGGKSRRLGLDKSTMVWPLAVPGSPAPEGPQRTLLEVTGARLAQVCDEVLVVAYHGNHPLPYRIVPDLYEAGGSLGGIYSGLAAAAYEYALVVATDMPFLSLPLLRWMLAQPRTYDALVPVRAEPEPLHAIYARSCLEPMRRRLDSGRLKITGFFEDVRVQYVSTDTLAAHDPQGLSFFNINTPEDLQRARDIAAGRRDSSTP